MSLRITDVLSHARLDVLTAQIGDSGILRLYDGTRPGSVADPITGTQLAELVLGAPFAAAASDLQLTVNAIVGDTSADDSGTATHFRVFKSDGVTPVMDGDVSALWGGGDLELENADITAGQPIGVFAWGIGAANGGRPSWVDADDILRLKFDKAEGPCFWRDGALVRSAAALQVSSNSEKYLLTAADEFRSIPANRPPQWPGDGLSIFAGYQNTILSPSDFTSGDWANTHITTPNAILAPDGSLTADLLTHDGTTNGNVAQQLPGGFADGADNASLLCVRNNNSERSHFQLRSPPSTMLDVDIYWDAAEISSVSVNQGSPTNFGYRELKEGWYELQGLVTLPAGNTGNKFYFEADADRSGKSVYAWGAGLYELDFAPPFEPATREKTTITDPDFAALAAKYSLSDGFKIDVTFTLSRLSDNAPRCLFALGDGADDSIWAEISSANTVKMYLRNGATNELVIETGAFTTTGEKTVTLTAKNEAWALAASGVAGAGDAGSYTIPALTTLRFGSRFGDADYCNGVLKSFGLQTAA
jgi:hypothetical protein